MFVPIAQLKSVLADLIVSGRSANPLRPWLGVYAEESEDGRVVVLSLADGGPALEAGIEPGDVIVSAGDARVHGLADFYRKLWNGRGPGDRVTLTVERDGKPRSIDVLAATAIGGCASGPIHSRRNSAIHGCGCGIRQLGGEHSVERLAGPARSYDGPVRSTMPRP